MKTQLVNRNLNPQIIINENFDKIIIATFFVISIISGLIIMNFDIMFKYLIALFGIIFVIYIILKNLFLGIGILAGSVLIEEGFSLFSSSQSITKLLAVFIIGLGLYKIINLKKDILTKNGLLGLTFIFFLWILVTTIAATNTQVSIMKSLTIFQMFFLYIVMINLINSNEELEKVLFAFMWTGITISLYSLLYNSPSSINASYYGHTMVRLVGTGEDPNLFAQNFLLLVPVGFYFSIHKSKLYIIPSILFIFITICTLSRGALVGLIIVIISSMTIIFISLSKFKKYFYSSLFIISFVSILLFINSQTNGLFFDRISQRDGSVNTRLQLMDVGMDMGINNFIFGVGIGNFRFNSASYGHFFHYMRESHNGFLEIFATLGLPGLVIFLLIIFFVFLYFKKVITFYKDDRRLRDLYLFLAVAFVSFLITGFFIGIYDHKLFWFLVAFATVSQKITYAKET